MTGGLAAAGSIAASIRGDCSETQAAKWHSSRVALSYTRCVWQPVRLCDVLMGICASSRFLIVVLSAYKQIRAQSDEVLVDLDEGNFERAFSFMRPSAVPPSTR